MLKGALQHQRKSELRLLGRKKKCLQNAFFFLEKEMVEVLNKRTDGMSIATGFKPITAKFNLAFQICVQ